MTALSSVDLEGTSFFMSSAGMLNPDAMILSKLGIFVIETWVSSLYHIFLYDQSNCPLESPGMLIKPHDTAPVTCIPVFKALQNLMFSVA